MYVNLYTVHLSNQNLQHFCHESRLPRRNSYTQHGTYTSCHGGSTPASRLTQSVPIGVTTHTIGRFTSEVDLIGSAARRCTAKMLSTHRSKTAFATVAYLGCREGGENISEQRGRIAFISSLFLKGGTGKPVGYVSFRCSCVPAPARWLLVAKQLTDACHMSWRKPRVAPFKIDRDRPDNSSLDTLTEEMIHDLDEAFKLFDKVRHCREWGPCC